MAAALPGRTDGSENEPSGRVQKPVQQPLLRPLQQPFAFACSNTDDVRTTKVEKLSGHVAKRLNQDSYASPKKHDALECHRLLRIQFHVESRCRGLCLKVLGNADLLLFGYRVSFRFSPATVDVQVRD